MLTILSCAVVPPLTPVLFTLPAMSLRFHQRCGESVKVKEGGLVVEKTFSRLVLLADYKLLSIRCCNNPRLVIITCHVVPM